jgi:hypothetical protein
VPLLRGSAGSIARLLTGHNKKGGAHDKKQLFYSGGNASGGEIHIRINEWFKVSGIITGDLKDKKKNALLKSRCVRIRSGFTLSRNSVSNNMRIVEVFVSHGEAG